jgi:hypothetical protein
MMSNRTTADASVLEDKETIWQANKDKRITHMSLACEISGIVSLLGG